MSLNWADWAESTLADYSVYATLYINAIAYTEVSVGFEKIEDLESAIHKGGFQILGIPKEALFLAGKTPRQAAHGHGPCR